MWSHLLIGLLKQSSVGLLLVKTICLFVFLFICSFLFFILFFYFLYIYRKQTLPSYLHSESKQCLLYIYPIYLYLQIMGWTNKTLVWYWEFHVDGYPTVFSQTQFNNGKLKYVGFLQYNCNCYLQYNYNVWFLILVPVFCSASYFLVACKFQFFI